MPLLIDYYTIHEMDRGRIGFAPHNESEKPMLESAAQPRTLIDGTKRPELIYGMKTINAGASLWSTVLATSFYLIMLVYGDLTVWPAIVRFFPDETKSSNLYARYILFGLYLILMTYYCFWIM